MLVKTIHKAVDAVPYLMIGLALGLMTSAHKAFAEPFNDCPADAFLGQNSIAQLYGVKLATGYYSLLSADMGTSGKINALGYNQFDNYIYAWSYQHRTLAQIDRYHQITPLAVSNLPGIDFYVGDVAVSHNAYYSYRSGSGLFRINLDASQPNFMVSEQVASANAVALTIFDMAFHPTNELIYSVDRNGKLYRFNTDGTLMEYLADTGQSGTFGAVYFDVNENLYISRNSDGHIFRIKVGQGDYQAEFFAYGPSSSNNDGARCALAPITPVDNPTIDFGDAPFSYGTSLDANGARHDTSSGTLFMGAFVDAEPDASGLADLGDDGVAFITSLEVGSTAYTEITASAPGYINAWIDFDRDGEFDSDEKIISSYPVNTGANSIAYQVPIWATDGSTWSRFRISSEESVGATGGVSDGEVEDYSVDLTEPDTTVIYYPGENQWATLAFEDNWPLKGDYDFNDLVVNYRITEYVQQNTNDANNEPNVRKIKIDGRIVALGASYHSGFAFHLPGVDRSQVIESGIRYQINGVTQSNSPLESGRQSAILFVAEDLWEVVTPGEACKYYRTEPGCGSAIQMTFSMTVPLVSSVAKSSFPPVPYDPFLTAAEGYEHGYVFGQPPGRAYEIHLKNMAPTEAGRLDFLNRGDDFSNPPQGEYYVNENGMPWAINVPIEWSHPLEYMDIIYAYPEFQTYATSGGTEDINWFQRSNALIRNLFSN